MPWRRMSVMDQRREFVLLAMQDGVNRRELCRRFGISADTGYRWMARYQTGDRELADRSRKPGNSPFRCPAEMEVRVLAVRDEHPAWGARKIERCLHSAGVTPPAVSTIHQMLRRNNRIGTPIGGSRAVQRFEMEAPNLLWQMDYKGWVAMLNQVRCHPLTVLDDHSRFSVCLVACANEQGSTVRAQLELTFRRYGLPNAFFVDNGGPWGDASGTPWTRLGVWPLKLGVNVVHSRPYHPQSRGKNERFHRTLKAEVFALRQFRSLDEVQQAFDHWRVIYNPALQHPSVYVVEENRFC